MRDKLRYVDALRVVLVLCVLLAHLPEYLGLNPLSVLRLVALHTWWGEIGVSGFLILSAFSLTYSLLRRDSDLRLKEFFFKRFVRLIPLYYVAIFAWLWIVGLVSPASLLAHMFCVHVFFRAFSRDIGCLWFVGLIVQWYLIFPLACTVMRKARIGVLWGFSFLIYILGLLLSARGLYVEDTFLFYSIDFLLGMDLARLVVREGKNYYLGARAAGLACVGFAVFVTLFELPLVGETTWVRHAAIKLGGLSFFLLALNTLRYLEMRSERWVLFLSSASYASYPVYLLHRPIWTIAVKSPIWTWLIGLESLLAPYLRFIYLALLGIPGIFAFGFCAQSAYDSLLKRLLLRHPKSALVVR
jgi:peptidoglycan/LPS O-acetylase OafA/YrhL